MGRPSVTRRTPERIDFDRQVIELRRAGMTMAEIANTLGVSTDKVTNSYDRGMKLALRTAGTEELRTIEGDRLDRLQRAAWGKAVAGDLPAIHTVLRLMERRAKLFGLDAPIQVGVTVEHLDPTVIDSEVARLAAMLKQAEPKALSNVIDVEEHGGGSD